MSALSSPVEVDERAGPSWAGPAPTVGSRLLVVAPHPDDEVLGCGGLLRWALARGLAVGVLAVTDGEASHARSARITAEELVAVRAVERGRALAALGVDACVAVERLGLPDGDLAGHEADLVAAIAARGGPGTTVVAPRADDGHPDHEVVGRAAAGATAATGATLWSVAIWAKVHRPDDLDGARLLHLDPESRRAKAAAVAEFRSQVAPLGPHPEDGPVVHPDEVAAMLAGPEVVVVR